MSHHFHAENTANAVRDELWTEVQVATHLVIAPKTLRAWRSAGGHALPYVRLSQRIIRYRRSDVEAFVARNVRQSTSDRGAV